MAETADGNILTDIQFEITTPRGEHKSTRDGRRPDDAAVYSSTLHFLKAVKAAGTSNRAKVMEKMRELPVSDFYTDNVKLREDGRLPRKAYIAQIKPSSAAKEPWDYYQILSEISPDTAWRPLSDKACPFLK